MNKKFMGLAVSLLMLLTWVSFPVPTTASPAVIYYVDADASGASDGTSWTDAYKDLQDALANAQAGDQIWVAAGIYKPGTSRTDTFALKDGVEIYGGFDGTETELSQRNSDPDSNGTILSGDIGTFDDPGDNVYQVVTGDGIGATTVLDGFTITAGRADGSSSPQPDSIGGGMYNFESSPTLTNCNFSGNSTDHYGGGMYNNNSSPTLTDCSFNGNSAAAQGGGMYNSNSNPTLTNCPFSGNHADGSGGMHNSNSSPNLTNCIFSDNWCGDGDGGGMSNYMSSPTLTDCTFSGNLADLHGGGLYNNSSSPTLTGCSFSENVAWASGGGMLNIDSSPTLTGCNFSDNSSTDSSGGGMYNSSSSPNLIDCTLSGNESNDGGGMCNENSSNPTLTNCTFSNNLVTDGRGGGMLNIDSSPTLTDCSFSGNVALFGGGLYNSESSPTITNCSFNGNEANNGSGILNFHSSPMLTNCSFSGNSATYEGGGMLNAYNSSPTLTNCTFSGNEVTEGVGGGMYNDNSWPSLTNCTFSENVADNGGGMYNLDSSNPTLTDCNFSGNGALDGGGMGNQSSNPTLTNCTFGENGADSGGGMSNSFSNPALINCTFSGNAGGGMSNWNSNPTLSNCTFSRNSAEYGGGMGNSSSSPTLTNCIFWGNRDLNGTDESSQINTSNGTPVVNYCCIQGWTGEMGGTGNIGADPLFTDADGLDDIAGNEDDNLRLSSGSPCIDAGDNTAVPDGVTTDLDGAPRILDGDNDGNAVVDMGAYEYEYPTGSISVTSMPAGASFIISGTASYSGTTPWSESNAPAGSYTIAWNDLTGYTKPSGETQELTDGGSISFVGSYVQITHDLTISISGSGTTSPSDGVHTYNAGETVSIYATPDSGWQFDGWIGDVADPNSASTSVTIDGDKTVSAVFAEIAVVTYDLTIAVSGNGTCSPSTGSHTYNVGTVVNITATPDSGWQFDSWTGDVDDPSSASTTVTIDKDKTVTANFTEASKDGEAGGCCSSSSLNVSVSELAIGWGIIGLCWGGGYYMVRRSKRFKF